MLLLGKDQEKVVARVAAVTVHGSQHIIPGSANEEFFALVPFRLTKVGVALVRFCFWQGSQANKTAFPFEVVRHYLATTEIQFSTGLIEPGRNE